MTGLAAFAPAQQRNFHVSNDNDWTLYWLAQGLRSSVQVQPVTPAAFNRWRAELSYSESGDANYTRTLVMTRDFGAQGATLTGDSLPTAGRIFWVRVLPIDGSFFGDGSQYTVFGATQALPTPISVTLTTPSNGASFTAPANVNLAATATGNNIARVEFYRDRDFA